eukprot:942790-Amphidinium_carterae.1
MDVSQGPETMTCSTVATRFRPSRPEVALSHATKVQCQTAGGQGPKEQENSRKDTNASRRARVNMLMGEHPPLVQAIPEAAEQVEGSSTKNPDAACAPKGAVLLLPCQIPVHVKLL